MMADRLVDAAGGSGQAGTPGDVRPHRRRPRPRPRASDPEHRQQLQVDAEDVRGPGVSRRTFRRMVDREFLGASSACSRTCATSDGRSRSSAFRSTSTAADRSRRAVALLADQAGVDARSVALADDAARHRRRSLRARPRAISNLLLNAVQATAPGGQHHDREPRRRRARDHRGRRHRLRHRARAAAARSSTTTPPPSAGPRPRPGDLAADRRAAGRDDCASTSEVGTRHDVHAGVPGAARRIACPQPAAERRATQLDDACGRCERSRSAPR